MSETIQWSQLESLFKAADVFLHLGRSTPPFAILDAMSYELPVVGLDSWANPEYIQDHKTGLLVHPPTDLGWPVMRPGSALLETPESHPPTREPDARTIDGFVETLGPLIEDAQLRIQLGKAGRWEIENGKFSIANRNAGLGRMFEEAVGEGRA